MAQKRKLIDEIIQMTMDVAEPISDSEDEGEFLKIDPENQDPPNLHSKIFDNDQEFAIDTAFENLTNSKDMLDAKKKSNLTIIQGGPGTGKSSILTFLTRKLIVEDQQMFIVAPTTFSRDCLIANINHHMEEMGFEVENSSTVMYWNKYVSMIRSPTFAKLSPTEARKIIMFGTKVVIGTVGSKIFKISQKETEFHPNILLIDNIEQIHGTLSRPFFETMDRICVTTDPARYPAAQLAENSSNVLSSHFPAGAKFAITICSLNVSYQMNEQILSLCSGSYCKEGLRAHESVAKQTLSSLPGLNQFDRERLRQSVFYPLVFCDTGRATEIIEKVGIKYESFYEITCDGSYYNIGEAALALQQFLNLRKRDVPPNEIAILTPFEKQKEIIKELLEWHFRGRAIPPVVVETVDKFHEQVREVIIFTSTRCNPIGEFNPFMNRHFFDVVTSRAKCQFFFVGSLYTFCVADKLGVHWSLYDAFQNNKIGQIVSPGAVIDAHIEEVASVQSEKPKHLFGEGFETFIEHCTDDEMKRKCVMKARLNVTTSYPHLKRRKQ